MASGTWKISNMARTQKFGDGIAQCPQASYKGPQDTFRHWVDFLSRKVSVFCSISLMSTFDWCQDFKSKSHADRELELLQKRPQWPWCRTVKDPFGSTSWSTLEDPNELRYLMWGVCIVRAIHCHYKIHIDSAIVTSESQAKLARALWSAVGAPVDQKVDSPVLQRPLKNNKKNVFQTCGQTLHLGFKGPKPKTYETRAAGLWWGRLFEKSRTQWTSGWSARWAAQRSQSMLIGSHWSAVKLKQKEVSRYKHKHARTILVTRNKSSNRRTRDITMIFHPSLHPDIRSCKSAPFGQTPAGQWTKFPW